jgi:hypothetical protein
MGAERSESANPQDCPEGGRGGVQQSCQTTNRASFRQRARQSDIEADGVR